MKAAKKQSNSGTCLVAITGSFIVGVIKVGNDGRRGYIYHTVVHPEYRKSVGYAICGV